MSESVSKSNSVVRTRYAPSPTGYLHVGGARTALYCYLWAKNQGGKFILRIEDTDAARSTREFESAQIADLHWLGIDYDEGPGQGTDKDNGSFGPYRQSERLHIYKEKAEWLIGKGQAFYCFCTEEELERKKEEANSKELAPHYDGTCRKLSLEEAKKRLAQGERATVRFKVYNKSYAFRDHVRGDVEFPEGMVGDFVILRSDGFPVYNYCCVVDDWLMQISHVMRAEEHLPNTLRQLMLYEAFGVTPPEFAHMSLLVGDDRQKLSKRHGATSVTFYKEEAYLKEAMVNYLVQLGWSHPEEKDIFDLDELIAKFSIDRFSKSPAVFDLQKLKWFNGQYLRKKSNEELVAAASPFIPQDHPFHKQKVEWQLKCLGFFKNYIDFYKEFASAMEIVFNDSIEDDKELRDILAFETTPTMFQYLQSELSKIESTDSVGHDLFISEELFDRWSNEIKTNLKIKGKNLFLGMRALLTGRGHGLELKSLLPLTPIKIIKSRFEKIKGYLP
ncbi:MAG: glutamate--tRNA ligase [Oligoflexia bacterium]|nr:glutamate--tRNA ligase [Oligoflexia bacterium]